MPGGSPIELRRVKAWWSVAASSGGAATTPWVENNGIVVPSTGGRTTAAADDLALTGKVLKLESSCGFNVIVNCAFGSTGSPIMTVLGTEVTLAESVAPSARIEGSPLLDGRAQRGTQPLGYSAADADSGVSSVAVQLNGTSVATTVASESLEGDPSACPHTGFAACPAQHSGILSVDTTKVPDGVYRLVLVVADAAGNVGAATNIGTIPTAARVTVRNGSATASSAPAGTRWRVTLRVTPHRVRNGGSVLFRGKILNRPLESGKNTILQVRQGGRWRPFATPVASASGAFSFRQRFTQSKGQRLVFRAVIPREKGYASATGTSSSVVVRVR